MLAEQEAQQKHKVPDRKRIISSKEWTATMCTADDSTPTGGDESAGLLNIVPGGDAAVGRWWW